MAMTTTTTLPPAGAAASSITQVPDPEITQRPLRADAQRNRDRIMKAAEAAFREDGAAVQMEEIARAAGVGVGTLYRHFPTKEALVAELVAVRMVTSIEEAERALAESDAWTALEHFVYRSAEQMATDVGLRDAIVGTHGLDTQAIVKWKSCAMARECLRERVLALLDRAKADGSLRPDVTQEDFQALICGLSGAIGQGGDWRRLTRIVLAGLRAAPAA